MARHMTIINANVLDVKNGTHELSTVKIEDGIISDIETQDGFTVEEGKDILDIQGKFLSPGFIDTHSHLVMYSNFRRQLNCSPDNVSSIEEMIEKFIDEKDEVLRDGWLRGYSYNEFELAERRHPNRFDLDKVSTEIPIYVQHSSAHMGAVNTKALEIMGVGLDDEDPQGGRFERDENGQVNGVLFEFPALDKAKAVLPEIKAEDLADDIEDGIKEYQSRGITSATEMCVGLLNGINDWHAVLEYLKRPQHFRTRFAIDYKLLLNDEAFLGENGESIKEKLENLSKGFATLGGAKFFNDGSIQIHTAALREDYHDGTKADDTQFTDEELMELYTHFQKLGYPLITHSNGDKAAEAVIDAYVKTKEYKRTDIQNRVEHLQTVNQEDIQKMVDNNIGGSFFMNHIYYFGDVHKAKFLGPERVKNLEPVRWAEDQGMTSTIHSDCPVTDISPLHSISIAVDRRTRNGDTLGDTQKLTRPEAYRKMTLDAAILNGTEDKEGSIEVGKYADFVVLSENPFKESKTLSDELVQMTIVDGKIVYEK
ncbi:amidohydrolase [Salinicoccus sp. YB14-2]|uniref:amidohydrolase n=1 Tax=Salinicoccus sp. YB14-2 TaxID=1572701 RepID=UPI000A3F5B14|nr:amidohydrolase [Salinicoccus sp. YB14-2]